MDPGHWGLSRLTTPGGVPLSSVSNAVLGHYPDLPLLDPNFQTAAGLAGALSPPISISNPLTTSRIPSLSPGSFGHSLPTFLDTVGSLSHPANHSAYKSIPLAQQDLGLDSGIHGLAQISKGGFHEQDLHRSAQSVSDAVRAWENRSYGSHSTGLDTPACTVGTFSHDARHIYSSSSLPVPRVAESNLLPSSADPRHSQRAQVSPPEPPPAHSTPSHRASAIHRNPYQTEFLPDRHIPVPDRHVVVPDRHAPVPERHVPANPSPPTYLPQGTGSQLESLLMGQRKAASTAPPASQSTSRPPTAHQREQTSHQSAHPQSQYSTGPVEDIQYQKEIQRTSQQTDTLSSHQYDTSPQMPALVPLNEAHYTGSPQLPAQQATKHQYGTSSHIPQHQSKQYANSPQITQQQQPKQPYTGSPQYGGSPQMPPQQPKQQYAASPQVPPQQPKQQYGGSPQMTSQQSKQQYGGSPQMSSLQSKQQQQQYGGSPQMPGQQSTKQHYVDKSHYAGSPQIPNQQQNIHQNRKSTSHRYPDSPQLIQQHSVGEQSPIMPQSHSQQTTQYSSFTLPPTSYADVTTASFEETVLQSSIGYSSVNLESATAPTTVLDEQCFGDTSGLSSQPSLQSPNPPMSDLPAQGINDQYLSHQIPAQQTLPQPNLADRSYQQTPSLAPSMAEHHMGLQEVHQPHTDDINRQNLSMNNDMSSDLNMMAAAPIQAIADSTTGPKKARGRRKKKEALMLSDLKCPVREESPLLVQQYPTVDASVIPVVKDETMQQRMDPYISEVANTMESKYTTNNTKMTNLGDQQCYQQQNTGDQTDPDKMFMTNMSGNIFQTPPPDMDAMNEQLNSPPSQPRTKAQQKQMPASMQINDDAGYMGAGQLKEKSKAKFTMKGARPAKVKDINTAAAEIYSDPVPSSSLPKPATGQNTFMNSFLSFLQGQKGETLSSVTNSAVTDRPPMPKYIPEPKSAKVRRKDPSGDVPILLMKTGKKTKVKLGSKKTSVPSMDFSDDEENSLEAESRGLDATVKDVLSNLNEEGSGTTDTYEPPSLEVKVQKPGTTKSRRLSNIKKKGKSKRRQFNERAMAIAMDVDPDAEHTPSEETVPPPVVEPVREKSSRKAKDKVQEKMNQRRKKKMRKGGKLYDDDDFSSGDEFPDASSEEEKAYDSDKDPAWTPFATDTLGARKAGSDSEDDEKRGKKKRGRRQSSFSGRMGRGRRKSNISDGSPPAQKGTAATPAKPTRLPASFRKGSFVIDKRHLDNPDEHPIWKIDAGKLLQKFEPISHLEENCHRALCTYSSWTESIEEHYVTIKVTIKAKDVVQMHPIESHVSELQETHLPKFNVYMQILVSQSLEPSFLTAIQEEGDEYYIEPLNHIDGLIEDRKSKLQDSARWKASFLEQVEMYPDLNVMDMRGLTEEDHCQATDDREVRAEKLVRLSGQPYDNISLEPQGGERTQEFAVSLQVAEILPSIHSLHHMKNSLYVECSEKVRSLREGGSCADDSEVLDHCLQNRDWVLGLFTRLAHLLEDENT